MRSFEVPRSREVFEALARTPLPETAPWPLALPQLQQAERLAAQANGVVFEPLPAFGGSGTAWPQVHRFYAAARSFRSCRGFREAEPDSLREAFDAAFDRKERRRVEKQLAACRTEARRAYESQVRKLADFCRRAYEAPAIKNMRVV